MIVVNIHQLLIINKMNLSFKIFSIVLDFNDRNTLEG